MKKATLILLVCTLLIASVSAVELSDRGYTVSNERVEDDITLYDVRDSSGNRLTVGTATGSFTNENMNVLEIVRETFFNMSHLEVASMKVVFSRNRADVVVIPRRYTYDGIDLAALMPSGMQFIYTDYLEYDFRMLVDGLFVRIQGQYFTEQQFLDRLARAARNPAAYIQSTDPRFIFRRMDELSRLISELESKDVEFDEEIDNLIDSLRDFRTETSQELRRVREEFAQEVEALVAEREAAVDRLERGQASMKEELEAENRRLRQALDSAERELRQDGRAATQTAEQARSQLRTELEQETTELGQEITELRTAYEGLLADHVELARQFNLVRRAVLVFENRNFFGGLRIPDAQVVEELVELKLANPSMTIEEAEAAINEGREESVSGKVVTLVFSLYFNEFE